MPADRPPHPTGLRRSAKLIRLYRREPIERAAFSEFLARDTLEQLRPFRPELTGTVVDVGGGAGYLGDSIRQLGGRYVLVDSVIEELHLRGRPPRSALVGDGQLLPLRDDAAQVVHCSNVLEHVRTPERLLSELTRVLEPGGIGYLAFTPWLSPWGGHETSPWHYLGGERALRRYERRTGRNAKNRYGTNLFPLHIPSVRSWFEANRKITVLWQGPRYWPPSWHWVGRAGAVGEAVSWNHLVIFRREPDHS